LSTSVNFCGTVNFFPRYPVMPVLASRVFVFALVLASVRPALAQAPSTDQKPCSPPGDSSKTLSEKLDQGGGVICPPDVDPAMEAPVPETGKMPVIPPPGSPGGNPQVQPK
jgi:hypothetical protein